MNRRVDPYATLRIPHSATIEEARAAFRAQAKKTHPDMNGGKHREQFEAACNAWEEIKHRSKEHISENMDSRHDEAPSDKAKDTDEDSFSEEYSAIEIVRSYIERLCLVVRFDGNVMPRNGVYNPTTFKEIEGALERPYITLQSLTNRLILHVSENKLKISGQVLSAAIALVVEDAQVKRKKEVLLPLYIELSSDEMSEAERQWMKLSDVFLSPKALTVAILKKFIYQVKRKSVNKSVDRHLMPVIQNRGHGGGKTSFVKKLLAPLSDLQSAPTLFKDYMDHRSADLYNYPVIFIDDIAKINPDDLPILNGVITGEELNRRRLGTMGSIRVRQTSTLIGTCNKELAELIPDETGNRRFAALPFRNGAVEKGGSAEVWDIINRLDYSLLWRSVDVLGDDPILPELESLERWQGYHRRKSDLEQWLGNLDTSSPEVLPIREPHGIKVSDLHTLYQKQTETSVTLSRFGTELGRLIAQKIGPFIEKKRYPGAIYCTLG